jgi:hypothetical protein
MPSHSSLLSARLAGSVPDDLEGERTVCRKARLCLRRPCVVGIGRSRENRGGSGPKKAVSASMRRRSFRRLHDTGAPPRFPPRSGGNSGFVFVRQSRQEAAESFNRECTRMTANRKGRRSLQITHATWGARPCRNYLTDILDNGTGLDPWGLYSRSLASIRGSSIFRPCKTQKQGDQTSARLPF